MKYKKYIFALLLTIFMTLNSKVYAEEDIDKCYYMGNDFSATFAFGRNHNDVYVDMIGDAPDHDPEDMLNWRPLLTRGNTTVAGHKFKDLYSSVNDARTNGQCPKYLVIQYCNAYKIWGTNDATEAQSAANDINNYAKKDCVGRYATYLRSDGTRITSEEYYSTLISPSAGGKKIDMEDPEKACAAIFGDKDYAGEKDNDTNGNGIIDPPSLAYLINSVLAYIRIIVPILIVLLGMIDLAKAVLAGKEDEMRKAQKTFVKRIVAGVLVFFVPVIVNLVMNLADIVWEGLGLSHCNLP